MTRTRNRPGSRLESVSTGLRGAAVVAGALILAGCPAPSETGNAGSSQGAAGPAAPPVEKGSAAPAANPRDAHLPARFVPMEPPAFPTEEEAASGCQSATSAAIGEMEAAGAIVEATLEEYRVRKLDCRWAPDDRRIAECRFEKASIPGAFGDEAQRRRSIRYLRERDWKPASARFAFVAEGRFDSLGKPSWVATDACEPFVFKAGELDVDLREAARRRIEAKRSGNR
ncbi:MAG TPA: hypothetical protein VFR28_10235 [Allosphingosinicella sp.]|nr:hypothetical protein [Allosphingosinicella sp.]